ncbi:MAG: AMP-binding protein, partial [bacterium]|nr:AMP-binding protein [bacterium]
RKVALYNYYGPTEATVSASFFSFSLYGNSGEVLQAISIGKPMDNYRIYILDQNKKTVPVGVNGELCIAGPAIAAGYLNQPELTADTFIDYHLQAPDAGTNTQPEGPSGFQGEPPLGLPGGPPEAKLYKTGDLARRLPDGNIEFLGRIDHQVKIRGFRMELGEIERCLAAHPNIKEAVVLSRESNDGNNFLCAYYVETGTGQQSVAGLKDFLSQSLPDYMIPPFFIKLETIPLTGNGKIDRKALGRLQLTKHKSQKNYTAPRDETEEKLNLIWAGILGTPKQAIGIDDNFFDIGGHSLRATVMVSKIHKEFNVKVPLPEIFANPSIRALADNLKGVNEETYHSIEPAEKKEYYVLSSAQKRLYILEQMESMAYNMPGTVPLAGETDPAKLEAALKTLIQRHDSFRTSFHMINETPVQVVHDTVPFTIEKPASFDRSTADPLTAAKRAFFRPFDLSKAPLLRVGFVETPGGQKENPGRYMLLDMHHIITDGVSREILTREFFALIAGEELPPLTVQYRDYAQWRAGSAQKQLMEQQEEFWLNTFPDELPVLELPTDYPRPVIQSFEGKRVSFVLTQEETRSLNAAANENEATLYMTVLAIFTILLSRLGGREDIIVGAPTAGRRHADLDNIIGMFVNTLAMRNYPEGEKTVGAFLGEVRENTLNVFENQEYQFEDLVDKLSLRRDTGRNPIFDVMFNMLNLDEYDPQDTTLFLEEPENDADGALSSAYVLPG